MQDQNLFSLNRKKRTEQLSGLDRVPADHLVDLYKVIYNEAVLLLQPNKISSKFISPSTMSQTIFKILFYFLLITFIFLFFSSALIAEPIWHSPYQAFNQGSKPQSQEILNTKFNSALHSSSNSDVICPIKPSFLHIDKKKWCRIHKATHKAILQEGLSNTLGYEKAMSTMLGLIQKESSFRSDIIGKSGEIGLAQIKPATGRFVCKIPGKELFNVESNLICSAKYLNILLSKGYFENDLQKALIAYNQGWGNVKKGLFSKQDKRYAKLIISDYSPRFQKIIFAD